MIDFCCFFALRRFVFELFRSRVGYVTKRYTPTAILFFITPLDILITLKYNKIKRGESKLHQIYFYKDKSGSRPVADYIIELKSKTDKESRVKLSKIQDYINALSEYGLQLKEPYIKHLDGDIWELRPLRDRILFAAWHNGSFVLLHQFMKKTPKTPKREIEKAKRELADFIERSASNE